MTNPTLSERLRKAQVEDGGWLTVWNLLPEIMQALDDNELVAAHIREVDALNETHRHMQRRVAELTAITDRYQSTIVQLEKELRAAEKYRSERGSF